MSKREALASCVYAILSAVVIIGMAVLVVLLSGCKVIKEIPVEKIVEKTSYQDRFYRDSIYLRDSIYIEVKGDTVWQNRDRYLYKDREVHDTVRVTVTDSIPYPVEVEKKLNKWNQLKVDVGGYLIGLILLLIAIIVGYCVKKK